MQLRLALAGLVAVAVALARPTRAADVMAQPEVDARAATTLPAAELELRLGLGRRNDTLAVRDVRAAAEGGALSDVALAGAWFGRSSHLGVAARFAMERFALRGSESPSSPEQVNVSGLEGSAALALRGDVGGWLRYQGEVGYGLLQLPVVFVNAAGGGPALIAGGSLGAHGPVARAGLVFALGEHFGVELGAEALPFGFGARYDGLAVTTRRLRAGGGLAIGLADAGGARWVAVAGYDFTRATADGQGASDLRVRQVSHHVGFGVRVVWPAADPARVEPPAPGRLRVIVREKRAPDAGGAADAAAPLMGIEVAARGTTATTDERGEVLLERLGDGPVELRLTGAGFVPGREVVAAPPTGEATVEVLLARAGEVASAAITGLVRSTSGMPVAARVGVLELGLEQVADGEGAFRFEVPPGRYTLTIAAEGFIAQRKLIRTGADEQRIFNIDLQTEAR